MLESHFDTTASIDRLATTTGNKKVFISHIATLSCHIQPANDQISGDIPGGFGKDSIMFTGDLDIQEGDRVMVGTDEYRVVGTELLSFGRKTHRETRIRIFRS